MFMEVRTMGNEKKWQLDLGEYIRQGEPSQAKKANPGRSRSVSSRSTGLKPLIICSRPQKITSKARSTSKKPSAGSSRIMRPQTSARILKMTPPKQISFPPESPNF